MTVYFNDEPMALPPGQTLLEFLMTLNLPTQPYALAVNESFVPKPDYALTLLADGDKIDLVIAAQGG
jgi:sulfur carrier protein